MPRTPAKTPSSRAPDITPVAEDFLKAIWSATEWGGVPATGKSLAERFGTTPASVTDTIKRLAGQGLLTHEPYKPVQLTPAGERHALAMVRKHRLIESFLVRTLGYSWDEVHDEAENLEHAVSDKMIERIDSLLGHPEKDPHGDPIPASNGTTAHPPNAVLLADAAPGSYEITRISDDDPALLAVLAEQGVLPGTVMTLGTGDAGVARPDLRIGSQPVRIPAAATSALWLLAHPAQGHAGARPPKD